MCTLLWKSRTHPDTDRLLTLNFNSLFSLPKNLLVEELRQISGLKYVCATLWHNRAACRPSLNSCETHSHFTDTIRCSNKTVHFHPAVKQLTFMFTGALCYLWPLKACCLWVLVSAELVREWWWTEADHVVTFSVPLSLTKPKTAELRIKHCSRKAVSACSCLFGIPFSFWTINY